MEWLHLSVDHAIEELIELSRDKAVFVFKHSPSCSISSLVLKRVEKNFQSEKLSFATFLINVLAEKNISKAIADKWKIVHESPQALIIHEGNCIYYASHMNIILKEFPMPDN